MEVHEAASRLLACPRLSRERETKRQRSFRHPLEVNWREKIETNGQVYISISSEEEEEEEKREDASVKQISMNVNANKKHQPIIVTVDSSSDEEVGTMRLKRKLLMQEEDEANSKEKVEGENEKQSAKVLQELKKHQRQIASSESVVWGRHHVAGLRKRRLGEEDAAFLLFYGDRETPNANILRLIIELISTGVGASNEFLSRFIKYSLWCRLSFTVDASLANERLVQSEWTKIVFSCPAPPHRRRSGPMPRPALLPRPITITVRPLQLARKRPQRRNMCVPVKSSSGDKYESINLNVTPEASAVASANKLSEKRAQFRPSAESPKKSTKTTQTKSPRGKVRKRPLSSTQNDTIVSTNEYAAQFDNVSPRKNRRRNGEVGLPSVTPQKAVQAKSTNGQSISQKFVEPLPCDCRTLGDNWSLPYGWRPPGRDRDRTPLTTKFVEVNPMLRMTADEIAQHIASLRREGRFTNFEKVTDILLKLMSDPRNRQGVFNTPVDPVALELPTYTKIVQHPMDLGTVKCNLTAGKYLELDDFISDVRLVFRNAMLFNPESHYIHVDAKILLNRFNESVRAEQNRQIKRRRVQHVCSVCRGNSCIVCHQQCLDTTPPHLQCSGGCTSEIRKGSVYFVTEDGTRVWCQRCKARLTRDHNSTDRASNDDTLVVLNSLIKKKCEIVVEPWVKCGDCNRWLHQVCGLYNPVIGAYEAQKTPSKGPNGVSIITNLYVCPLCRCRRKRATPPLKSPMRKILHADPDEHVPNTSSLNIPSCELSLFIQAQLCRGLIDIGEHEAARTLYVRALSFPGEHLIVPESVVRTFDGNAQLLAQLRPGTDTSSQRIPAQISYLSRGLYLFQKHEGMEVCLFTIYAQEYGENCELETNQRAVYIAYLDSVRYLKPTSARTTAYHLILLAYFDYVRCHGFSRVHIWSCPPQKRISYVFWCRPSFQKTPSAEHLRRWYNNLLAKAKECGIVKNWSTLYERYFSDSVCGESTRSGAAALGNEEDSVGVSTRGTTVLSVNPDELVWPANQLPPIFDGDIIPSELERVLGRIMLRNEKQKRANENKKLSIHGNNVARVEGKDSSNGEVTSIKEEAPRTSVPPASLSGQVDIKVREVFSKCQFAIQRLKNDLLVVDLQEIKDDEERKEDCIRETRKRNECLPETLVSSSYEQVPRFFSSRFMFHQLCSLAGYQFDSLRRAKHSTMMMVHHYFNEQVAQLNVFCRECSLLITRADFWSCRQCVRYALCDSCYRHQGNEHPHPLVFGPAPLTIPPQISQRPFQHSEQH